MFPLNKRLLEYTEESARKKKEGGGKREIGNTEEKKRKYKERRTLTNQSWSNCHICSTLEGDKW